MITITKGNQEIRRLPSSRMLKSEVAEYADRTISIVRAYGPESLLVNPVFNLLLAKEPEIEILRLSYGVDTERLRTNKLKAEMMLAISAFKLNVRRLNRSNLELDLHVIQNAINSHLRYLNRCRNDKELNQKVTGFLEVAKTNERFAEALDEFDLTVDYLDLQTAHEAFNEASRKRVKLLSERPNISTQAIVKSVIGAIDNLLKTIEVAHLINTVSETETDIEPDTLEDFSPLINELEQLSNMFYRSISIRDANNKRKANMDKTEDSDSTDEPETSTEEDASTEVETTAMNGNGAAETAEVFKASTIEMMDSPSGQTSIIESGNGSLESVDKEKAVDSRWGSSQQPLSTDKA